MTTLGFGDMRVYPNEVIGHIVLSSLISVLGTYIASEAGPVSFPEEKKEPWSIMIWPMKIIKRFRKTKSS